VEVVQQAGVQVDAGVTVRGRDDGAPCGRVSSGDPRGQWAGLSVCLDGLVPVAQDHLATIRKAVGAVLRRHGFQPESKRTWHRGDDAEGWVVVAWQGDKWNTKAQAEASLSVAVWPPGTREHLAEMLGRQVEPFVAANAPVLGTGRTVAGDPTAGSYPVVADMADEEVAEQVRRAEAFAEATLGCPHPRCGAASQWRRCWPVTRTGRSSTRPWTG
jgi:hypothetical protein